MAPYYETAKVRRQLQPLDDGASAVLTSPLPQSFSDVLITDEGVETASFLHASDDFVAMFGAFCVPREFTLRPLICRKTSHLDLLGTGVFSFVQTDLRSNIAVSFAQ